MNRSTPICLIAALVLCASAHSVSAQTEQIGFVGVAAPAGSITSEGQGNTHVYLRWEFGEGSLPDDLVGFNVIRGGVQLNSALLPAQGVMPPGQISLLYAGAAQSRRRNEIIRWLNEEDPDIPVNVSNFGVTIANKLATDSYWAREAARIDPNIAAAQYRGFVHQTPSGTGLYQLMGVFDGGETRILGAALVDANAISVSPAAQNFRALTADEMARCDAPERQRAHGTTALTWEFPATTPTDLYGFQLTTAGYDLWRTVDETAVLIPLDLRTAAAASPQGPGGVPLIAGLERVNDQPLVITGTPDTELGYSGWAPTHHHVLLTEDELAEAGIEPGDTHAYYLVARDFTGNYGDTAQAIVSPPDRLAPPTPWDVTSYARPEIAYGDDTMLIRFPAVDVDGFLRDRLAERTVCNLDTLAVSERIRLGQDGQCGEAELEYNLDVDHYLVYRFPRARAARRFSDADGDGVRDGRERTTPSDPGTACDPTVVPAGATSFLAATVDADADVIVLPSGRRVFEFADPTPGANKGQEYWYRIAAVAANGEISPLSAPARALFPQYQGPTRKEAGEPTLGRCETTVSLEETYYPALWFTDLTGDAAWVRLSCSQSTGPVPGDFVRIFPIFGPVAGGVSGALIQPLACVAMAEVCQGLDVKITFYDEEARPLGTAVETGWNTECENVAAVLSEDCTEIEPIRPGEIVDDTLLLDVPDFDSNEECIGLYRDIGGRPQRLELLCDDVFPLALEPLGLGAGEVCLSVAVHDTNNLISLSTRLPCFTLEEQDPQPPQALGWTFPAGDTTGEIGWRPPAQPTIGTIVEWYRADGSARESRFVTHDAASEAPTGRLVSVELGGPLRGVQREEWCFRARTVVLRQSEADQTISEWSPELCALRSGPGEVEPEYLPWPDIPAPPRLANQRAAYLSGDNLPVIDFAAIDLQSCSVSLPDCIPGGTNTCVLAEAQFGVECPIVCHELDAALADSLGFVVYRQSRVDAGTPSGFTQVSPLVDYLECRPVPSGLASLTRLADPFFSLIQVSGFPGWEPGEHLVYKDIYPHELGVEYRYQLVFYTPDGAIEGWAQTNWITAEVAP